MECHLLQILNPPGKRGVVQGGGALTEAEARLGEVGAAEAAAGAPTGLPRWPAVGDTCVPVPLGSLPSVSPSKHTVGAEDKGETILPGSNPSPTTYEL